MITRLIVAIGILVLLVSGFMLVSQPTQPDASVDPSRDDSAVYTRLAASGIADAVVDVTDDRALIRYEVPENASVDRSKYAVIGIVATTTANQSVTAHDPDRIVVQVYEDYDPVEELRVETEIARRYAAGDRSLDELKEAITVVPLE